MIPTNTINFTSYNNKLATITIMKNHIIYLFLLIATATFGEDGRYMLAMQRNVSILDSARIVTSFQLANNAFERIANANPNEWLPLYYESYCHIMIGMQQEDRNKKDEYFDQAQLLADKADSLSKDNSEIYVLKAFINSMKISVDPANRGQKLGMQSSMLNTRAIELDKDNPRAYLLKGTGLMYTPAQYGGGKEKALPVLEMAVEKFKSFQPKNQIMPHWGEARANTMLEQCKKAE
jgi:hypothetical protein